LYLTYTESIDQGFKSYYKNNAKSYRL
jgi:hypothetical protein